MTEFSLKIQMEVGLRIIYNVEKVWENCRRPVINHWAQSTCVSTLLNQGHYEREPGNAPLLMSFQEMYNCF